MVTECGCSTNGSANSSCSSNGICSCKANFDGKQCNSCKDGFYDYPNCYSKFISFYVVTVMWHIFICFFSDCNCDSIGSLYYPFCNAIGNCICKANVNGTNCDVCNDGYYNLQSGDGCILCNCDNLGSINATCHIQTGQCFCKPGYVGIQCDQCQDGYFGDPNGLHSFAQPCQECNCNNNIDKNEIGNCDTLSGKCLKCINFTSGFNCETCEDGYYGDATTGNYPKCKLCTCYANGTNDYCDNFNGKCTCKSYVSGKDCDKCNDGYFGLHSGDVIEKCIR